MSSFLKFMDTASGVLSNILGALGGNGGDGCTFTLSGGSNSVTFPVSPPDFEVVNPYNNSTVNINNLGEINMIGKRGLATMKFSSFFPAQDYNFLQTVMAGSPYELVGKVKQMAESGQPCHISITGTDVSLPVTIDEFTYKEKDGSGDVYFSLSLKEYRYIMSQADVRNDTTGLKSRIAETGASKKTTCLNTMHALDNAQKAFQKTTSIVNQGKRAIGLYKSMVKSGGIPAGTVLTTVTNAVRVGDKNLYEF